MRIDVTGADVGLSDALRENVQRQVLLALSRFGPWVLKVTVRLAAPPNPLGGVDQQCRIRARLQETPDIRAEAINGGFEAAVARAAAQLARRMDSALDGGPTDGAGALTGTAARLSQRPAPGGRGKAPKRRA